MRAPLARKRARSTNLTRVRSQIYTPSRRYWSVRRALWMRGRWCGSPAPSMTPACVHPSAHAAVKLAVPVSAPQASPGGRCRPMMVLGVASSTRLCAACAAVPPPGCRLGSLDGQRSALRCLRCPPLPLPCVLRARLRRVARRVLGRRGRRCWTAVARVPPMRGGSISLERQRPTKQRSNALMSNVHISSSRAGKRRLSLQLDSHSVDYGDKRETETETETISIF